MSIYIVSGNFSTDGIRGMLANPSDREAAVRPLVEASGGKILSYLITLGETDFMMQVESDKIDDMLAAMIVAGASGGITNLKTVQAFTSGEFMAAQRKAKSLTSKYTAPNKS
jgi:uncharacterized protein with GYD domain